MNVKLSSLVKTELYPLSTETLLSFMNLETLCQLIDHRETISFEAKQVSFSEFCLFLGNLAKQKHENQSLLKKDSNAYWYRYIQLRVANYN